MRRGLLRVDGTGLDAGSRVVSGEGGTTACITATFLVGAARKDI